MQDIQKEPAQPSPSLGRFFFSFLRLGTTAFGGPAMIAHIRDLAVGRKRWLDKETFRDGVALFLTDLPRIFWSVVVPAMLLIAFTTSFLGLFIAVSVSEIFEAQTFFNFFRFPVIFLHRLFFPVIHLPAALKPLSFALPLTYGADLLHQDFGGNGLMSLPLNFGMLLLFCAALFLASLHNIKRHWIA